MGIADILIIIGLICFVLYRHVAKELKGTGVPDNKQSPKPPIIPDVTADPLPEPWHRMNLPTDTSKPRTTPPPIPKVQRKKKAYATMATPYTEAVRTTVDNETKPLPHATKSVTQEQEEGFGIHTVEDARRAIIWGEIMQRKY